MRAPGASLLALRKQSIAHLLVSLVAYSSTHSPPCLTSEQIPSDLPSLGAVADPFSPNRSLLTCDPARWMIKSMTWSTDMIEKERVKRESTDDSIAVDREGSVRSVSSSYRCSVSLPAGLFMLICFRGHLALPYKAPLHEHAPVKSKL